MSSPPDPADQVPVRIQTKVQTAYALVALFFILFLVGIQACAGA